jgi:uncharacterized protein YciW
MIGLGSGLAFAALALVTASLVAAVRCGEISVYEMRAIIADAHALVHDRAGFVVDPDATEAADDFLSAAEALALAPRMPEMVGAAELGNHRRARDHLRDSSQEQPATISDRS